MPFGLTNAPGTFQKCMEIVFQGLEWKSVVIFLDDLILFNDSFDSHLENLNEVLRRLTEAGLKLKPSKCNSFQKEVVFLGHVVSESDIKHDPSLIDASSKLSVVIDKLSIDTPLCKSTYKQNLHINRIIQ